MNIRILLPLWWLVSLNAAAWFSNETITTDQVPPYLLIPNPPASLHYMEGLERIDYFTTPSGHVLRYATFTPAIPSTYTIPATILLLHGRATFIEYYEPIILPLLERGLHVVTYDLEGQGLSTRFLENRKKGHVDSFTTYLDNLDAFIEACVDTSQETLILMGYSLGGHIALRYLQEYDHRVDGAFVLSPMLGIPIDWFSASIVHLVHHVGLGEWFVPDANEIANALKLQFEDNDYTRDPERFEEIQRLVAEFEEHAIGGTTFSWAKNAFDSCEILQGNAGQLDSPVFILLGGSDSVVETETAASFCTQAPNCRYKVIEGAYHELFREDERTRRSLWRAFDSYMRILPQKKMKRKKTTLKAPHEYASEPLQWNRAHQSSGNKNVRHSLDPGGTRM